MPASDTEDTKQAKAKELFMNGVWCEQNGLIYEGMFRYSLHCQLIDICMAWLYACNKIQQCKCLLLL